MIQIELSLQIHAPLERCFDLARSIEVHLLGAEQTGEMVEQGGVTTGLMGIGDSVRWRAKHLGLWRHLTSRITALERPTYFQDTMTQGAFRSMQHDHFFQYVAPEVTEMRDRFRFSAPIPGVGWLVEQLILRRYMRQFLR